MTRERSSSPGAWASTVAIALAATASAALPSAAAADPVPVTLTMRDGHVAARIDLSGALPADLPSRLGNGLRNVLAVYVGVVPVDGGQPSAGVARVVDVLYDVWDESWTVTVRDALSPSGRRKIVTTLGELRAILAHAADADLGPPGSLPAGLFTVDVRLDVNPVSPELLAQTREYLAGAAGRPGGASRSVLGTVAGFLLREPSDGDEVLFFRSAPISSDAVNPR